MTSPDSFLVETEGPEGLYGVFEDDGDTGYLYLYEPGDEAVVRHLHIYDRSPDLHVKEKDVSVVWSDDKTKCGVVIWGEMRGIIDRSTNREGRIWLENRDTPGIDNAEWLRGF